MPEEQHIGKAVVLEAVCAESRFAPDCYNFSASRRFLSAGDRYRLKAKHSDKVMGFGRSLGSGGAEQADFTA
jgi:hypothetical protein